MFHRRVSNDDSSTGIQSRPVINDPFATRPPLSLQMMVAGPSFAVMGPVASFVQPTWFLVPLPE